MIDASEVGDSVQTGVDIDTGERLILLRKTIRFNAEMWETQDTKGEVRLINAAYIRVDGGANEVQGVYHTLRPGDVVIDAPIPCDDGTRDE